MKAPRRWDTRQSLVPSDPPDLKQYPVLIVDDEPNVLRAIRFNLESEFTLQTTESPADALARIQRLPVAVLIADQRMPEMTGIELIEQAVRVRPTIIPILLTGYTDAEVLARAINLGCIRRYIAKPFDPRELREAIQHALEAVHLAHRNLELSEQNQQLMRELRSANEQLRHENRFLRERAAADSGFEAVIGNSAALQKVVALARKVADTPTTVLIEGPTGTGKERLARAIHYGGARRRRLFVAVNAGATPESLLASTLFGHRRGAFTGAAADAKGLFETASGGTIFLDEIGEASPAMQVHLLRVLQDGEIWPVGATKPVHVDARVVTATNRDLEVEVRAGRFREDLFHRLRTFRLRLPALAEHPEDIPPLAEHFVARMAHKLGKTITGLTPEAVAALGRRNFPGNVRELENLIERAVLFAEPGGPVTEADLCDPFAEVSLHIAEQGSTLQEEVASFERERLLAVLDRCGGNKSKAARLVGLTYRGFLFKLQRHGLMTARGE